MLFAFCGGKNQNQLLVRNSMEQDSITLRSGGKLLDFITVTPAFLPKRIVPQVEQTKPAMAVGTLEPKRVFDELSRVKVLVVVVTW